MELINFKKKKMKLLTNEQQKSYENSKICYYIYLKETLKINMLKIKKNVKLGTIVIIQVNIEVHNIAYVMDHCHYTGEYRGAQHCIFYLKYIVPKKTMDLIKITTLSQ